jgi:Leucine rich repeat
MDEVPLPPLRRVRHRSPGKAPEQSFRKPQRLSGLSQTSFPSSDPALFSSDDIPSSSLENYHGQQQQQQHQQQQLDQSRKRRYRGTWWGEMAKDTKRKRADFKEKRNLDSGVWMGSDESSSDCLLSSEASSCEEFMASAWSRQKEQEDIPVAESVIQSSPKLARPVFVARNLRSVDEPQEHIDAAVMINECLEKGQESVDLRCVSVRASFLCSLIFADTQYSNFVLKSIPTDLLRPLLHLTKQPAVAGGPVTDEVFTSLTPFLRLFLSGNSLTELTSEVFELGNLNVLSLRNNKLREIPGAIRKLTRLQEINLSMNRLSALPWEMLWLIRKGDLKQMTVHPNPFMSFDESRMDIEHWHCGTDLRSCEYQGPAPEDAWAPIHIATSRVQRFDSEGNVPIASRSKPALPQDKPSRVPSLRELALLECNKYPYLDQFLADDADMAGYPEPVIRLLRRAVAVRNAGGMSCSVCHRSFVIPRTEWIEWWDCTTYENGLKSPRASGAELRPLPFLRRGCSWGCVPEQADSK